MTGVYQPKVRMGNWFEDLYLEQEKVETFQKRRQGNNLFIEKTRQLFDNFHKRVDLEAPKEHIRFGAIVQLTPCRMRICGDKNFDVRPALSVNISSTAVRHAEEINEDCELSIAPAKGSYVRNSFRIKGVDNIDRSKEFLKYGQPFLLECVGTEDNSLLVYAAPKSADLSSVVRTTHISTTRGEVNLPLGLVRRNNCGVGKDIPYGHTMWYCSTIDPRKVFETTGTMVPSNSPIVVTHLATNRSLAAQNVTVRTFFGLEYLVSVQNYKDAYRRFRWQNVWMVCNGSNL